MVCGCLKPLQFLVARVSIAFAALCLRGLPRVVSVCIGMLALVLALVLWARFEALLWCCEVLLRFLLNFCLGLSGDPVLWLSALWRRVGCRDAFVCFCVCDVQSGWCVVGMLVWMHCCVCLVSLHCGVRVHGGALH